MSTSSAPMMPNFTPMKKKVIAVIAAVIIGHTGMMWALKNVKPIELKPLEKEPLKVRFVKIQEQPKPKIEPEKEKPKPKEVKIVEKKLPPPPSKKVEKIEQAKTPEPQKQVNKPVESSVQSNIITTNSSEKKITTPVVEPVNVPVENPTPKPAAAPATQKGPKTVSIGSGIEWRSSPKPNVNALQRKNRDSLGQTFNVVVRINADEKGNITSAILVKKSENESVNNEVIRAVKAAKFKPYKEGGVAYPIVADQPFSIKL